MKKKLVVIASILLTLVLALSLVGCMPQGERGATGLHGLQGEQGIQGIPGPPGPKGDIGLQGEQGDQGKQGEQGKRGYEGDEGDRGPRGYPGATGAKGAKGATGATGNTGPAGDQGIQGEPGEDGTFPYIMQMGTREFDAPTRSYTGIAREIFFPTPFGSPPLVLLNIEHTFQPTYLIDVIAQDIVAQEIGTGGFTVVLLNPGDIGGIFTVNWLAISQ